MRLEMATTRVSDVRFSNRTRFADGVLVGTGGECKQGMDMAYDGTWGYHPLVVTLANSGEVLRLANRPGNRPSYEDAAKYFDEVASL